MAATPDYELELYQKLRQLLEASTPWLAKFEPGNRIWYNDVEGIQNPDKPQVADGDTPQSKLWHESGSVTLYAPDETLGTYSEGEPHEWLERGSHVFVLELKSQNLNLGLHTRLGAESRAAIRAGGSKLGLGYVNTISMNWATKELERQGEDDTLRFETRMRISIGIEYQGKGLLPGD